MKYKSNYFCLALILLPHLLLGMNRSSSFNFQTSRPKEEYLSQCNLDATVNGYRPSFYPDLGMNGYMSADFLFWQGSIDGFVFAWTYPEASTPGVQYRTEPIPNGKFHDIDYDWAPGVRVALGWHLPTDHWDLTLNWTGFRNQCTGHASISSTSEQSLLAVWIPAGYLAASYDAQHAKAKWRLNYNTLDLSVGRTSFAIKSIVINPVLGVRAAFIHQHFSVDYTNGYFLYGDAPVPSTRFTGSNQFNGWGIRPGLETSWHMTEAWSVYANSFVSALFGVFTLKEDAYMTSATYGNLLNDHDRYYRNAFALDLAAGLKWEMFFNCNRYHLLFSLGYEISSWFSQNQLTNFIYIDGAPGFGPSVSGDLGLQGLDLSARFDF